MQFNILGTFAQFYREQLAENVRMGTAQAARQGKWVNRPKTGYSLVDGELVPNDDAAVVRRIFRLRAEGRSYRDIESEVGIKYSTVRAILQSRIYLGEVLHSGQWYPGNHEPLVTEEEFRAADKAHIAGSRRSKDILSGRVTCGLCGRRAAIQYAPDGRALYRCHHRGRGCRQPARTAKGLLRAALLGLRLLSTDDTLKTAIREELRRSGRRQAKRSRPDADLSLPQLSKKRQKLLELYYSDRISAELFHLEEQRLTAAIGAATEEQSIEQAVEVAAGELEEKFEQVAAILMALDIDQLWQAATDAERRTLIEELVQHVAIFPDHLEVTVAGAPRLNVLLSEVGLKESRTVGGVLT